MKFPTYTLMLFILGMLIGYTSNNIFLDLSIFPIFYLLGYYIGYVYKNRNEKIKTGNPETKKTEWIDFTEMFLNIIAFKIMFFSALLSLLGGISLTVFGMYTTTKFLIWLGIGTILTAINGIVIYSYSYVNELIKAKGERK